MTELAVQDEGRILHGDREGALDLAQELGATCVRLNLYSGQHARHGFGLHDPAIDAIRRRGMSVHLTVTGCPRWDPEGGPVRYFDPSPAAFGELVARTVGYYRGVVAQYAMWNEPNHPAFMRLPAGKHTADRYRKLYAAGWAAAKRTFPEARVLWGEVAASKTLVDWIRRAAPPGQRTVAHGLAWHPYQYRTPPERLAAAGASDDRLGIGGVPRMRRLLDQLANEGRLETPKGNRLPLYLSEFGYWRDGWNAERSIPEDVRADWVARAWRWSEGHGVRQLLYYHLTEPPPGTSWNTGIVTPAGERLPAFGALRDAVRG